MDKYGSSLRRFYHHVSEKHSGELIQITSDVMPGQSDHPWTAEFGLLPDVHSSQFFGDDADPGPDDALLRG